MPWTTYAKAMLAFNLLGILTVYGLQRLQGLLPLNPQQMPAVPPDSKAAPVAQVDTTPSVAPVATPPAAHKLPLAVPQVMAAAELTGYVSVV